MNKFYIDSCIYLNLWQKEGDETKGMPYWLISKSFFERFDNERSVFYYSGFILKELSHALPESKFSEKTDSFKASSNYRKISLSSTEFHLARKIESEINYDISFFDIIHMLLAKKTDSILVTRDKELLKTAKQYGIKTKKPEDLL
ncbi:MAG: PIN domain-containing protein [archaeon]